MAGSAMRKSTGLKPTALAESIGKSNAALSVTKRRYPKFVVCIDNQGHEASLSVGKIYRVIRPEANDRPYELRVIDEEREDYLYPGDRFVPIEVPNKARHAIASADVESRQ